MKTNRNFQSTLRVPRAAFLGIVGSKRGGPEVVDGAMLSEVDEHGMSVMFGTACVDRSSPERVGRESPEKAVEMPSTPEGPREDVPLVEFGPSVRVFRIEKYAV